MVDGKRLESSKAFNTEHIGYINCIFYDTCDSRLRLWEIQKYKEVIEFINRFFLFDMDVISPEELIIYDSLVQEDTREYHNIVDSKWWKPDTSKEKSQDQT